MLLCTQKRKERERERKEEKEVIYNLNQIHILHISMFSFNPCLPTEFYIVISIIEMQCYTLLCSLKIFSVCFSAIPYCYNYYYYACIILNQVILPCFIYPSHFCWTFRQFPILSLFCWIIPQWEFLCTFFFFFFLNFVLVDIRKQWFFFSPNVEPWLKNIRNFNGCLLFCTDAGTFSHAKSMSLLDFSLLTARAAT